MHPAPHHQRRRRKRKKKQLEEGQRVIHQLGRKRRRRKVPRRRSTGLNPSQRRRSTGLQVQKASTRPRRRKGKGLQVDPHHTSSSMIIHHHQLHLLQKGLQKDAQRALLQSPSPRMWQAEQTFHLRELRLRRLVEDHQLDVCQEVPNGAGNLGRVRVLISYHAMQARMATKNRVRKCHLLE